MATAVAARPYQMVVWGATGFTGRLVCEHIARDYQGKIRWALAGRDQKKLDQVRQDLVRINPACKDVPILTADAMDGPAVGAILKQTEVVLSLVGPFARYGNQVVAQSLEQGTHYCDITGEVTWVKRNVEKYHGEAEKKGVKLLHCCGYDSIPSDLGTLMMVDHARKHLGRGISQSYTLVREASGGISGGTIASIFDIMTTESASELAKLSTDQYYLAGVHGKRGSDKPAPFTPSYNQYAKAWTAPFLMEGVNAKIVQLSNALAPEPYGTDFKYREALGSNSVAGAGLVCGAMAVMGIAFMVPPMRWAAKKLLPGPGQGPTEAQRLKGQWRHDLIAITEGPGSQVLKGECGDKRDPGYWSTSRMILETGLCLVLDGQALAQAGYRQGGVLTPGSACGMVLLERLRAAGFTFKVQGPPGGEPVGEQGPAGKAEVAAEPAVAAAVQ